MTAPVTRVAWVLLALVGLLVANLQVQQLFRDGEVEAQPGNRRALVERFSSERGLIVLGEEAAARSVRSDDPEAELEFAREYPLGTRAAHVVGWSSAVVGTSGVERLHDAALTPGTSDVLAADLTELLGGDAGPGDTVRLTLDPEVQATAERALGDRVGAVIALDTRTGEVLAHASSPTFDPGPLANTDRGAALDAWDRLRTDPANPLLDRAARELYPPGSTFKLVVAAAALEAGVTPTTAFPDTDGFQPRIGEPIANFSGGTCLGGDAIDLTTAFAVSCNTVFARLATQLGPDALAEQARRLGFDRVPPYDLGAVASTFPDDLDDATLAQSGIGQFDVRATALQMAMAVAAVVNDGVLLRPYVVRDVRDDSAVVVQGPQDGEWAGDGFSSRAMSSRTADQLRDMLVRTVEDGTGSRAAIPGVVVGGKTGTAQDPSDPTPTAWFVGFADDRIAVAVVVPDAGGGGGGSVAAPIGRRVLEAGLTARP